MASAELNRIRLDSTPKPERTLALLCMAMVVAKYRTDKETSWVHPEQPMSIVTDSMDHVHVNVDVRNSTIVGHSHPGTNGLPSQEDIETLTAGLH